MTQAVTRQEHFAAHTRSGKTITAYCKEHGINPQHFYQWRHDASARKRKHGTRHSVAVSHPDFIEVPTAARHCSAERDYLLRTRAGVELIIPFGADVRELRSVLRMLRDIFTC